MLILLMSIQEAIAGKCNAVCISKDERNQQPSVEELKMAHYVFYRTFDVQNYTISDELGEKIAMIEGVFLCLEVFFSSLVRKCMCLDNFFVAHLSQLIYY